MDYSGYTSALGNLLQYPIVDAASASPSSNANFNAILPRAIEYTEGRITMDMDFLATRTVNPDTSLTANSRSATLPNANPFFVIQAVNVITPAATSPQAGQRNPLIMVSLDFINAIWPVEQGGVLNAVPEYGTLLNDATLIVAPTPNAAYRLEYIGTIRFLKLSAANPNNYITLSYSELYLAASMIFMSGFQRDFGSQSDDPKVAQSWEGQYQSLLATAMKEEQRRKSQGTNWSPYSQTPLSTPRP